MKNPNLPRKGTPTALNVWVLFGRRTDNTPTGLFGDADTIPNRIPSTSTESVRRCLRAGLLDADGRKSLSLTTLGKQIRAAYRANGDRVSDAMLAMMSDSTPTAPRKLVVELRAKGRRWTVRVATYEEATEIQKTWAAKNKITEGDLDAQHGAIEEKGKIVAQLSFNGNIEVHCEA